MKNKTCGECRFHDKDDQCSFFGFTRPACLGVCRNFQQLPSNGDKIRQMSNEELAKFMLNIEGNVCEYCERKECPSCSGVDDEGCHKSIEAWLNAPAESEGKNE